MANPFFSGRIPPDLLKRVEQYCTETGETKTDLLINALSTYLNHPVVRSDPSVASPRQEERFKVLEERIAALELSFSELTSKTSVITPDNKIAAYHPQVPNNDSDNSDNKPDNNTSFSKDPPQVPSNHDDNSDNNTLLLKDPWEEITNTAPDDKPVINVTSEQAPPKLLPEYLPLKFENLTSGELVQTTKLKLSQLDGHKKKVATKYQKLGQPLEDKKLLEQPEKIESRQPITINGYPYDLFYLGQNEKGNNMWTALPFDNNRYQQLSI